MKGERESRQFDDPLVFRCDKQRPLDISSGALHGDLRRIEVCVMCSGQSNDVAPDFLVGFGEGEADADPVLRINVAHFGSQFVVCDFARHVPPSRENTKSDHRQDQDACKLPCQDTMLRANDGTSPAKFQACGCEDFLARCLR